MNQTRESSADYLMDHLAGRYRATQFPYVTPYTNFHELMTAEYSPLIELDASNGLSPILRDRIVIEGDGSVTEATGELLVATGAAAGSTALLATQERGRYQPGIVGIGGHCVRRPIAPTGDQDMWCELGDGIDGARVGEDSAGYYVQFIHGGTVDDKLYQDDWNIDNLTGNGGTYNVSRAVLDLSFPTIFRVAYTHYGVGPATIEAYLFDAEDRIVYVPMHEFRNTTGENFWVNPKLPLRQYVDNGTTGGNLELFVGGRHFAVKGRYNPNRRQTPAFSDNKTVPTGDWTPLVSFRKKDLRKWLARSVKVSGLNVLTTENLNIGIFLGHTLTDAEWGTVPDVQPEETAVEVDTAATALSGGTLIDGTLAQGGQGNRQNLAGIRGLGVDIPDDTIVTLAARARTAQASVGAAFTLEEEA